MTGEKKRKLVLINPVNDSRTGFSINHSPGFPPLGLGVIAALTEVVYRPRQMEAAEFSEVMRECLAKIYDKPALKARARQTLKCTGRWDATVFAYQSNQNYRAIAMAETTFS
jgi:hypothetical protein